MPHPHSRSALYFSGHAEEFDEFLADFERRAYDCALTGPQHIDTLICYIDSSTHKLCRLLSGYHLYDRLRLRQSLVNDFGTSSRHLVRKQWLRNFVQDLSRRRMASDEDVLEYHKRFACLSATLIHSGYLLKEERDDTFWSGFHPLDRKMLSWHLCDIHPFQRYDDPFPLKDVYNCVCRVFAYYRDDDDYLPPPSPKEFEHLSTRHEHPIATNVETMITPNVSELPSIPVTQPLSSSSLSLEVQHAPHTSSAMEVQTETETEPTSTSSPMLSATHSTLVPAQSSTPSLTPSCLDDLTETTSTPSSCSINVECSPSDQPKTEPVSMFLTPPARLSHSSLLAFAGTDKVPELFSLCRKLLHVSPIPLLTSSPSEKPELEPAPVSLITPSSALLPPTSPACSCTDNVPEPKPEPVISSKLVQPPDAQSPPPVSFSRLPANHTVLPPMQACPKS